MQESTQTFAYERIEGGARLLRCFSKDKKAVIPDQVDGYPVKEIGAYAFSAHLDEKLFRKKLEAQKIHLTCGLFEETKPLCGEQLEEILFAASVERIGAYCFYNCGSLRTLRFGSHIKDWGCGAFTGCHRIGLLDFWAMAGEDSSLKEVLSEVLEEVCVKYRSKEGDAKLMFPEYFEEGVENTPARILMTRVHGSGLYYRNCFKEKKFDFREYDSRFSYAVPLEKQTFLTELVLGRLRHPYQLTAGARKQYENYVREHLAETAVCLLEQREMDGMRWLLENHMKEQDVDCLNKVIEKANTMSYTEALIYLMDFRHKFQKPAGRGLSFEL